MCFVIDVLTTVPIANFCLTKVALVIQTYIFTRYLLHIYPRYFALRLRICPSTVELVPALRGDP